MRLRTWVVATCVVVVLGMGAPGGAQEAVLAPAGGSLADFESEQALAAWTSVDQEATLALTREAGEVRSGAAALEYSYTPRLGAYSVITGQGFSAEAAQSIRFSVKATEPTPLLYGVHEADDSAYVGFLHVPAGAWLDASVPLSELQLDERSTDENGAIDVAQIDQVRFADLSNLEGEVGRALGWKNGPQILWLDDIELSPEPGAGRSQVADRGARREIIVANFDNGRIDALAVGGYGLELVGQGRNQAAVKITYGADLWRWAGFVVGAGTLSADGLTGVRLRALARVPMSLHVLLEEHSGARYEAVAPLEAGDKWQEVSLPRERFSLDVFSQDGNGRLDAGELRVIVVVIDTFDAPVDQNNRGELLVDDLAIETSIGG